MVTAVRADVEREPVTTLPNDFVYTEPEGAGMFALDVETRKTSSPRRRRRWRAIRIELGSCDPGDTVRVEFEDVVLASEYHDLPSVSVGAPSSPRSRGTVRPCR